MALQMPPKAQGIEPDPLLPKAVADDWSDLLADVIWWFNGYAANASRRQRETMPDLGRIRELRTDIARISEGQEPLAIHRRVAMF